MISAKDKTILISGAGLVGSLLAVMLGRRGFRVLVYEKRPDMRIRKIAAGRSINLALANRGIAPLERAGVMDKVKPLILPMRGRMIHKVEGASDFQPYGQKPEEVIYSVSRAELNRILMAEAENSGNVQFFFEHEALHTDLDKQQVVFQPPTGSQKVVGYDLLIGSDGAASVVRNAVLQKNTLELKMELLDHSYKELHIEAFSNGDPKIDMESLHIWPRGEYMMIALPNPDKSFTVTLFLPNQGKDSFAALKTEEDIKEFFSRVFPDSLSLMPNFLEDFKSNPLGSLGTVRCYPWIFEDSAFLIGDAAHAIVPFHGQGMNCGFEDCEAFDRLLDTEEDLRSVLDKFQRLRKRNADAIADLALANYVEMRASVVDPRFLTKKKMEFELEKLFPDVFIPRYSRVMFQHIPYADAKLLGEIQETILEDLYQDYVTYQKIPVEKAKGLIKERLLSRESLATESF